MSVGRIYERWLNGFFRADSERYMLDSIFTGFVGVNGNLGFDISETLLSLRATDTKFWLFPGCGFGGEVSSTLGGEAFLGERTKCSPSWAWGKGPKAFLELLTEPYLEDISLFSLLPWRDFILPSWPRLRESFFLELNMPPSLEF